MLKKNRLMRQENNKAKYTRKYNLLHMFTKSGHDIFRRDLNLLPINSASFSKGVSQD